MNKSILKKNAQILENLFKLLDLGILFIASWLAYHLHSNITIEYQHYITAILTSLLIASITFPLTGLYQPWRGNSLLNESGRIFVAWSILFLLLAFISVLLKNSQSYSRIWFISWYGLGVTLAMFSHIMIRFLLRKLRQAGFNQRHIVIACHDKQGLKVINRLQQEKWSGYQISGIFSDLSLTDSEHSHLYQGKLEKMAGFVEQNDIDQVWISMPLSEEQSVKKILELLSFSTVSIRFLPDIFAFNLLNHSVSEVMGLPIIDLSSSPMQGINIILKQIEDKLFATFILILISPVMLFIALGIKLSSTGPVFYQQTRIGWNNKPFSIYKFRSMPVNAEDKSGPVWATENEHRATAFGSFLRRSSLDELPQFFNVLLGDMSIVGPRPERPHFVEQFKNEIPGYMKKHMVKAGITGWAQVNGWRGNTDIQSRIDFDLYYIENWSLWFDIKIIFLTIVSGFTHKNAY